MELIVALALATGLMVAVLGVLHSLTRQRDVLLSHRAPAPWRQQFREQLRRDIANARRCSVRWNEIRLVGYGGRSFDTGLPTHRPTTVVYRVHQIGEEPWLMRWEIHLDDETNQNIEGELVCSGVSAIVRSALDDEVEYPDEASKHAIPANQQAAPLAAISDHVRIVFFAADKSILFDETTFLRQGDR